MPKTCVREKGLYSEAVLLRRYATMPEQPNQAASGVAADTRKGNKGNGSLKLQVCEDIFRITLREI